MAFILVSNDDGFASPGTRALVRELKKKHELFIAVPDRNYSWIGTCSNTKIPVKVKKKRLDGLVWHVFNSPPVDCVNIALTHLVKKKPDAIVSGINAGLNNSAALTSGTIAAAEHGAWFGLVALAASVGFSEPKKFEERDSIQYPFYAPAAKITSKILDVLLEEKKDAAGRVFNVNFPQEITGEKVFLTNVQKVSPFPYFGKKNNFFVHLKPRARVTKLDAAGDIAAFERGRISLTPLKRFETVDLSKWKKLVEKINSN